MGSECKKCWQVLIDINYNGGKASAKYKQNNNYSYTNYTIR